MHDFLHQQYMFWLFTPKYWWKSRHVWLRCFKFRRFNLQLNAEKSRCHLSTLSTIICWWTWREIYNPFFNKSLLVGSNKSTLFFTKFRIIWNNPSYPICLRPFIGAITPFTTGRDPPCRILRLCDCWILGSQRHGVKSGTFFLPFSDHFLPVDSHVFYRLA